MTRAAGAEDFELLFQAALEFVANGGFGQAVDDSTLLLFERAFIALRRTDDLQDRRASREQLQMKPRHLPHIALLHLRRAGARQQIDDLARLRLNRLLPTASVFVEVIAERVVARDPILTFAPRIDSRSEAFVTRQRPEIQTFESRADQPQARIHERAQQREGSDAEPVRRQGHAERAGVEGRGEVRALAAHGVALGSAYLWNAGGTKARSVASRIEIRIWNSSTSAGTGF